MLVAIGCSFGGFQAVTTLRARAGADARQGLGSKFLATGKKMPIVRKCLPFLASIRAPEAAIVAPDRQFLPRQGLNSRKKFLSDSNGLAFTIH
jgi:hypothetical protein